MLMSENRALSCVLMSTFTLMNIVERPLVINYPLKTEEWKPQKKYFFPSLVLRSGTMSGCIRWYLSTRKINNRYGL